ncbi:MAG: DNA primase [Rhodothermia bacterium]|nr:MAG: DNA primase [Rhodothermia bacterium]
MAKIPQEIIEEVRSRVDIVDVVSDYVQLKKRGSNFVGLCPFHQEKTPSFNVNPARDIYKCFGCGVGGDVYNFVTEIESLSFPEAIRLLADRVGVSVPESNESTEEGSETDAIYHALRFAAGHFFETLKNSGDAKEARRYLKARGVTTESVKSFGIGFAPNKWDDLLTSSEKSHLKPELLERAGLIIPRKEKEGYYDRYRNRIVFPIVSHVGKVLGFGGRVVDAKDEPKYINSPETLVYNKSRVLYGLYQARQEIRGREETLLVEGYTDVVALHQEGFKYSVATCGTALTEDQIRLLGRYAKRIVLLYDADVAGARAAIRSIDLILGQGLSAYAVALPEGHDPDSYIKEFGREAFESYLKEHREDFVHFILSRSRMAGRMDTPEGQADVQRAILRSISQIPDPLVRESYLKLASDALDIPDMELRGVLREIDKSNRRLSGKRVATKERNRRTGSYETAVDTREQAHSPRSHPAEKTLLKLMLEEGLPLVELILGNTALSDFSPGTTRHMAECLVEMYEKGAIDQKVFVSGTLGDDVRELSTELLTTDIEPSENWKRRKNISVPKFNDDAVEAAKSAIMHLKLDRIDQTIRQQKDRIFKEEQAGNDVRDLQNEMMKLHEMRKFVAERKFIVDV